MSEISELARQLHQELLAEGFTSPERSASIVDMIGPFLRKNGDAYHYFLELQKAGLIVEIKTASIHENDKFYLISPQGIPANSKEVEHIPQFRDTAHSNTSVDWGKWGAIIGALALIATIIIAVIH